MLRSTKRAVDAIYTSKLMSMLTKSLIFNSRQGFMEENPGKAEDIGSPIDEEGGLGPLELDWHSELEVQDHSSKHFYVGNRWFDKSRILREMKKPSSWMRGFTVPNGSQLLLLQVG